MREMFEWQGPDIEEQFTFCIFAINFESKKFSLQTNFVRIFNNYGRLSFCLSFPLECFPAVFIILVDYHFAVSKFPNSKKLNLSFWLIIILVCTDCTGFRSGVYCLPRNSIGLNIGSKKH